MKFFKLLTLFLLLACTQVVAQNIDAVIGQSSVIKFNIPNANNYSKCNIEINLPNQQKISLEVEGPQYTASFEYLPQKIGIDNIQWEGKVKISGLNIVFGCPGAGKVSVKVNPNNIQIAQFWSNYFSTQPEEQAACIKYGFELNQYKYELSTDPAETLIKPDDEGKIFPISEKCGNFFKQAKLPKSVPCNVLVNEIKVESVCIGVYAEKRDDGYFHVITRNDAFKLHFDGKPWTVSLAENPEARTIRKQKEEEDRIKQAAELLAQKEAEEKERKLKESPEYKKQQAELERKRIAEEKAAALLAKKEQEAFERAERERERHVKAAEEAKRAQEEKQRLEYAREFPYYAEITCGVNNSIYAVNACFTSGNVKTDLEIRNGTEYKMYTDVDIFTKFIFMSNSPNLIRINLRQKFDMNMQNASDSLVMNLKVYSRANKQLIFEKSARRFGVIRASN